MKLVPAMIESLKNSEVFSRLQNVTDMTATLPADLLGIFEHFLFFWDFKEQAVQVINLNYECSGRTETEYQVSSQARLEKIHTLRWTPWTLPCAEIQRKQFCAEI